MKTSLTIGGIILILGAVFLIGGGMSDSRVPVSENILEQVDKEVKDSKTCKEILPFEFVKSQIPSITVIKDFGTICHYVNENQKDGVNFRLPLLFYILPMFDEKEARYRMDTDREEACVASKKTCVDVEGFGYKAFTYQNKDSIVLHAQKGKSAFMLIGEMPETNLDSLKIMMKRVLETI